MTDKIVPQDVAVNPEPNEKLARFTGRIGRLKIAITNEQARKPVREARLKALQEEAVDLEEEFSVVKKKLKKQQQG